MQSLQESTICECYFHERESEERLMVWRSLSRVGWKDEEGSFFPLHILPWITKKWFFPFRSLFHLIGLKAREACSNLFFLTWYLSSSCCKTGLSLSLSHGENSFSLFDFLLGLVHFLHPRQPCLLPSLLQDFFVLIPRKKRGKRKVVLFFPQPYSPHRVYISFAK